ncbi:MAG TPA: hypothetical protein VGK73_38005, partial [Polyangiaceae bacterium]
GNRSPSATFLDETGALRPLRLSESSRKASKLATWSLRYRESADIEAELASLAERFPVSPQPFCYRGELRLWLGRYAEARADFEAALARAANTRWAYIGLGASHLLEGRPERALEAFDRGAERTGPGPTLYVYRGEARLRLGQLEPALADLERARSMNPTRLAAYVTLALASGLSGDLDRRAALLAEIGARAPGLVSAAWFELGADHPPAQLEAASEEIPRFLEHLLCMLRGNRSSSLITYFTCDGALRFVPPRPTPDPIVMRSDLERLAHSLAAARRRPELLSG